MTFVRIGRSMPDAAMDKARDWQNEKTQGIQTYVVTYEQRIHGRQFQSPTVF
jgi:hypothetical protein